MSRRRRSDSLRPCFFCVVGVLSAAEDETPSVAVPRTFERSRMGAAIRLPIADACGVSSAPSFAAFGGGADAIKRKPPREANTSERDENTALIPDANARAVFAAVP